MNKKQNIAVLGLGAMGQRMAIRLLAAGHNVTVWNRTAGAASGLKQNGVSVAASPKHAAQGADVVISMVFDDAASRRVWLAEDGAAFGLASGATAIECSTLSPDWIAELNSSLPVALVDAPVAGSRLQAETGQLIFMAAGTPEAVDRAVPVLQAMAAAVHRVGASGSGCRLKLVVNAIFATQVVAMAEALGLVRDAGGDPHAALDALKTMPVLSAAALGAANLMLAANYAPQAPVNLISKDLGYALAAARRPLPQLQTVAQRFHEAAARGYGEENLVAVSKLYL